MKILPMPKWDLWSPTSASMDFNANEKPMSIVVWGRDDTTKRSPTIWTRDGNTSTINPPVITKIRVTIIWGSVELCRAQWLVAQNMEEAQKEALMLALSFLSGIIADAKNAAKILKALQVLQVLQVQ